MQLGKYSCTLPVLRTGQHATSHTACKTRAYHPILHLPALK